MSITEAPPLTVGARRRALCELADLFAIEQKHQRRPITEILPSLLPFLCAAHVSLVDAINLFAQMATHRAVLQHGSSTDVEVDRAAFRAEWLLDQLVGDIEPAVSA